GRPRAEPRFRQCQVPPKCLAGAPPGRQLHRIRPASNLAAGRQAQPPCLTAPCLSLRCRGRLDFSYGTPPITPVLFWSFGWATHDRRSSGWSIGRTACFSVSRLAVFRGIVWFDNVSQAPHAVVESKKRSPEIGENMV